MLIYYLDLISRVQFTYINMAFSPAPDDIVSNLFKVFILLYLIICNRRIDSINHSASQLMAI